MNSIGPHFFALDPSNQATRIAEFAEAIRDGNPEMSAYQLAAVLRGALASMSAPGRFPVSVSWDPTLGVEVRGRGYRIEITPDSIYTTLEEGRVP